MGVQAKQALNEMNHKLVTSQTQLDDEQHLILVINEKHQKEIKALKEKHHQEIDKLERGFQETLRQNEKKMQDLQTLRNNYEKKNTSLTKDVKKLIIQLEKQATSFSKNNNISQNMDFKDIGDDNEALKKLQAENNQLSEELIRKSQSLVDALRALAEFHENPVSITKTITSNLSHIKNNHHSPSNNAQCLVERNPNKQPRNYQDVSNQLQLSMEHELKVKVNKLEDAE